MNLVVHCFQLGSVQVYVWRAPSEVYDADCLLPKVKHEGDSVMVWIDILWYSMGPMVTLQRSHYWQTLCDHFGRSCPFHSTIFVPHRSCRFRTSRMVKNWFYEHQGDLIPWPTATTRSKYYGVSVVCFVVKGAWSLSIAIIVAWTCFNLAGKMVQIFLIPKLSSIWYVC